MITHIQGRLVELNPAFVVIECNGVGYLLNISLNTYSKLGESESCRLYSHLVIKEDSHTLYGFHNKLERQIFRLLISVSGVGASTARVILSSMLPEEIRDAIVSENIALITSVKGIGAKTAQRIIIDLKDKMTDLQIGNVDILNVKNNNKRNEALSALETLGFSIKDINKVLDSVFSENPDASVEQVIKMSLKKL